MYISIITPTFNPENCIRNSATPALAQNHIVTNRFIANASIHYK